MYLTNEKKLNYSLVVLTTQESGMIVAHMFILKKYMEDTAC